MKRLAIVLAILAMATGAFAQAEPGDIGIFCDTAGTQTTCFPPPFDINQQCYVVGFDLGGVAGYEFGVVWDPRIIVFGSFITPPTGSIWVPPPPTSSSVPVRASMARVRSFSPASSLVSSPVLGPTST